MINQPSVDVLINKLGTDGQPVSRYCLCVVAAKRARQVLEHHMAQGPNPNEYLKEISVACQEIADGKIKCTKD
ncbi:MAG TPA: DNA-directed RNA polymerase subunit omega [Clostridiales bacterium]|nr:DNA-directed RNA polymerase subunit omega [Clostridiales bacterium]